MTSQNGSPGGRVLDDIAEVLCVGQTVAAAWNDWTRIVVDAGGALCFVRSGAVQGKSNGNARELSTVRSHSWLSSFPATLPVSNSEGKAWGFLQRLIPTTTSRLTPLQKRRLPKRPELHVIHESALRDFAITNFRANGCTYFKLAEEAAAAAAAVQLKALLLDHGDELREWLGKDVFNTMDSEQRDKLKQEVPDGTFVDDGRLQISEVDMRLTARAGAGAREPPPSRRPTWFPQGSKPISSCAASSATHPPSSQSLPSCADATLIPRLSHAVMPIETTIAKNQFLALSRPCSGLQQWTEARKARSQRAGRSARNDVQH